MTRRSPEAWPEPFLRAKERLDALTQANGLRFATLEHYPESSGHAFAEYAGRGQRLRLVWEGRERALWVESAREVAAQVVSRWVDVEWSVAGTRLPLNRDTSDDRIDQLAEAVELFLLRLGSSRRVDSLPRSGVDPVLGGASPK